jgi:hypothetical protein
MVEDAEGRTGSGRRRPVWAARVTAVAEVQYERYTAPVGRGGSRAGAGGDDRILTIPNALSFLRLLGVPLFCG